MADIAQLLKDIINEKFNRNTAAFARAVEVHETTIRAYLNPRKRSQPPYKFCSDLVQRLGINPVWLLTGRGEMFDVSLYNGDEVRTYGAHSPGKIVGNVNYSLPRVTDVEAANEAHSPEDLHKIEILTMELRYLKNQNEVLNGTINDLRATINDLRANINELKGS